MTLEEQLKQVDSQTWFMLGIPAVCLVYGLLTGLIAFVLGAVFCFFVEHYAYPFFLKKRMAKVGAKTITKVG